MRISARSVSLLAGLLIHFLPWVTQTPVNACQTVSDMAVARMRPPGGPCHGDVCFSIRWMRDQIDPFETIKAFHGTRFDWVYATCAFIQECKQRGYLTCHSTSAARPDIDQPEGKPTSYRVGRAVDIHGKPLTADWQNWSPPWGCVSNPDFQDLLFHDVRLAIEGGADYMQIDDPDTAHMLHWGGNEKDPQTRGCFCRYCLAAFREYLGEEFKSEELKALGVNDVECFDYKQFILDGNRNAALRKHYETSYRKTVELFWRALIQRADRHAGRDFPFSCNNGSYTPWNSPHHMFDFAVGELSKYDPPSPQSLWRKALTIDRLEKAQVYTLRSTDPAYNRRVMCLAYALGNNFLVPWDVWIGGSDRFFGKPRDFNDVYAFVRANAQWLDGYEYAAAAGRGIRDPWYGDQPPVTVEGNADVYAFVRAVPGDPRAPAVVHLVDWGKEAKPFTLAVDPRRFSPGRGLDFELLMPVQRGAAEHEAAEASGDFSKFSQAVPVHIEPINVKFRLHIPKLDPWAMLIVETNEAAKRSVVSRENGAQKHDVPRKDRLPDNVRVEDNEFRVTKTTTSAFDYVAADPTGALPKNLHESGNEFTIVLQRK